jgi:hypothetical protein
VKSGGSGIKPPLFLRQAGKEIKIEYRKLLCKKKDGNSREKAGPELARTYRKAGWPG